MGETFDEKTLRKIEHRLVNRFGLSFEQSLVKPDKINAVLKELLKQDQFFESLTKSRWQIVGFGIMQIPLLHRTLIHLWIGHKVCQIRPVTCIVYPWPIWSSVIYLLIAKFLNNNLLLNTEMKSFHFDSSSRRKKLIGCRTLNVQIHNFHESIMIGKE